MLVMLYCRILNRIVSYLVLNRNNNCYFQMLNNACSCYYLSCDIYYVTNEQTNVNIKISSISYIFVMHMFEQTQFAVSTLGMDRGLKWPR